MELLRSSMLTNLKCTTTDGHKLFEAARLPTGISELWGRRLLPASVSETTRKRKKIWSISAGNKG